MLILGGVPEQIMVSGYVFFLIQRGCFFLPLGFLESGQHPSDPPGTKLVAWQVNSFGLQYPILVIGRRGGQGPCLALTILVWYMYLHEWLILMVYLPT